MDSIKADHGYNMDSKSVKNLLHIMSGMTTQERRDFLQFITGSPKLPIGGMFGVPCKPAPFFSSPSLGHFLTCFLSSQASRA